AVHPRWDRPGFPAPGGQAGSIAAAEPPWGPFAPIRGCCFRCASREYSCWSTGCAGRSNGPPDAGHSRDAHGNRQRDVGPRGGRTGGGDPAVAGARGPSCTIAPMFERSALPSGARVISARLPGARSVSIAAYVLAGSRLETPAQAGVAHFMEHITFKGTARFPSTRSISEAIEGVGGSFNAATDRESTVYWVRVPRREATRAMDVLGELIVRPTLADEEIDGERAVIVEEIRSYLDDPAEYAQILFQGAMFG